jgi:autophagy-related protein 11
VAELEESPDLEAHLDEADLVHPPTPRSLTNLVEWCNQLLSNMITHDSHSLERMNQLSIIQRSTAIALSNLLSHSSTVRDTARALESSATKELVRMKGLLNGHETDLKILSLFQINPKLLSSPDPSKAKPKERTLGDYVSAHKMGAVFQACSKVHNDLEDNLRTLKFSETQINEDTEGLRTEVHGTSIDPSQETYEESKQALERAREVQRVIMTHCLPDDQGWSAAAKLAEDEVTMRKVDEAVGELILLDEVARESLRRLTADKNDMMSRSLHLLGDISSLQSDYADLGIELVQLDGEFKSNRIDGFRHLARLRNMLWAYGSTLIEIYRRREFEEKFLLRSQALAELMANLSERERKRRSDFRGQVIGALPWDIKGMDENTPNLEISAGKTGVEEAMDIGKPDVEELFQTLDLIESKLLEDSAKRPVQEVKASLQQLVAKFDEAEAEFVKLVEVGLLGKAEEDSESEGEIETRFTKTARNGGETHVQIERLEREMQELKMQQGEKERATAEAHDGEIAVLQAELSKVKADNRHLEHNIEIERNLHEETRKQLESRNADAEVEAARRINMEEEVSRLRRDFEDARRAETEAKAEASEEIERANDLEAHLHDLQVELEEAKEAKTDACNRIDALLDKDTSAEKQLSVAQGRIDELSDQLSLARAEERKAREAQYEIETARDKLLRSHRAEADGDRAILEETLRSQNVELQEVKDRLRRKEKEVGEYSDSVKNLQGQLTAADEAHEELVRQLEVNREASLEAAMAKRQADRHLEAMVEKTRPMMLKLIELEHALRDMPPLSSSSSKANAKATKEEKPGESLSLGDSDKQQAISAFQAAGDSATAEVILGLISSLSKASPVESAISKLDSLPTLCKKWIRAYKHSNEKVQKQQTLLREKITFRNFGIGDLALFLPTRNNSGKPWAAFNINYPHFFLNFSGSRENEQLKESLQNKEWIVARITKIESRVATASKAEEGGVEGNPFQLAEGVKFHLLDVEGWNNVNSNVASAATLSRRKSALNSVPVTNASISSSIPALKRWESSPGNVKQKGHGTREAMATTSTIEDTDDLTELPEDTSLGSPSTAMRRIHDQSATKPDVAVLSTSSPVTAAAAREAQQSAMTLSRASSPSGIALSLRNRSTSPEVPRNLTRSANEIVEAGFTRWPTVSERQQQQGQQSNGNSSTSTSPRADALSEGSRKGLESKATPAFGRRKKTILSSVSGGNGTAMMHARSTNGPLSPPLTQDRPGQHALPFGVAQRTVGKSSAAAIDESPNPFSVSPAPPSATEMRDYFASRRQRTTSQLRQSSTEIPKEEPAPTNSADEALKRRTSSSSSAVSSYRPMPMLGTPRVRASATLSPSSEVAQGQHTLHPPDDPHPSSLGSDGTPMHYPGKIVVPRSNTFATRRPPSASSNSSWSVNWTLGRKSGGKSGEQSRSQGSDPADDGHLFSTSASQSLRRLADASGNSQ